MEINKHQNDIIVHLAPNVNKLILRKGDLQDYQLLNVTARTPEAQAVNPVAKKQEETVLFEIY